MKIKQKKFRYRNKTLRLYVYTDLNKAEWYRTAEILSFLRLPHADGLFQVYLSPENYAVYNNDFKAMNTIGVFELLNHHPLLQTTEFSDMIAWFKSILTPSEICKMEYPDGGYDEVDGDSQTSSPRPTRISNTYSMLNRLQEELRVTVLDYKKQLADVETAVAVLTPIIERIKQ